MHPRRIDFVFSVPHFMETDRKCNLTSGELAARVGGCGGWGEQTARNRKGGSNMTENVVCPRNASPLSTAVRIRVRPILSHRPLFAQTSIKSIVRAYVCLPVLHQSDENKAGRVLLREELFKSRPMQKVCWIWMKSFNASGRWWKTRC